MHDRGRILDAIDLRALADELLGPRRGTERSGVWPCPSPQHAQTGRTPPVTVFESNRGEQLWHCHGCGIGGTAIDLVMAVQGLGVGDALDVLAARAGARHDLRGISRLPARRENQPARARTISDPEGLAAYVNECAERMWRPDGQVVRRWLTRRRGLSEDVLRVNRIGADPGRRSQPRPDGMPAAGWAAVLPVYEHGRPVFAQLRSLAPRRDGPKYLNAANRLAPNPRIAVFRPDRPGRGRAIITEGIIDALSGNDAGYPTVAVLGAALAGIGNDSPGAHLITERLLRTGSRFAVAFDADDAGQRGGAQLTRLLREHGADAVRVHVPADVNDLNAWMRVSPDWHLALSTAVHAADLCQPTRARAAREIHRVRRA